MNHNEDLEERKLLGSGGYVFAKLTEQEELRASLGVPQIFLALKDWMRIQFQGISAINVVENIQFPLIRYESPNEELGKYVILIEKGVHLQNVQ